jgi:hypothetical protein
LRDSIPIDKLGSAISGKVSSISVERDMGDNDGAGEML